MISLPGYRIKETLHIKKKTIIYRANKISDDLPVIIKWLPDSNYPDAYESLKRELYINRLAVGESIIKAYDLEKNREGCGLILEDFGGSSLKSTLAAGNFEIAVQLSIALQMSESLALVHSKGIIHKDINPENFISDPEGRIIKLTDFGISTLLSQEEQKPVAPERLEGTLAYISPEQTGRINRPLDYRTDIYSLGVSFYELFTGSLPFEEKDAMGWLHKHIAVQPDSPLSRKPSLPAPISMIIQKMTAKNVENRYQSALGVRADLEECIKQLKNNGKVAEFEIGQKDYTDTLHISHKLYGRETQITQLMDSFLRCERKKEPFLFLVSGHSGVGKSTLVGEIQRPIMEKRGAFISGKFDQFKRTLPYFAFLQAFQELLELLWTEPPEKLRELRLRIEEKLAPNVSIITDFIPESQRLLGEHPAVEELGPVETRNRFKDVLLKFVGIFATEERRLTIFLDDLQWADPASLKFMELLVSSKQKQRLLIIGAYRDNEVYASHPLLTSLEKIKLNAGLVDTIQLDSLQQNHIEELLADAIPLEADQRRRLARLIFFKTEGNPFFITQFLKNMHQDRLIRFNFQSRSWEWDSEGMEQKESTENVVQLMLKRLSRLPDETQNILQLSACIGNNFSLSTLAITSSNTPAQTLRGLMPAIQQGLVIPQGASKELMSNPSDELSLNQKKGPYTFRFLHDRVQDAAYSLVEESRLPEIHLLVGNLILHNLIPEERDEKLFDITEHLNRGRQLILEYPKIIELIRMNLRCGHRAQDEAAYDAAIDRLETNRELLEKCGIESEYELYFRSMLLLAECRQLNQDYIESEKILEVLLELARTKENQCEVYHLRMLQYSLEANYVKLLESGIKALRILNVELPSPFDDQAVHTALQKELEEYKVLMLDTPVEALHELNETSDPRDDIITELISDMIDPSYFVAPQFMALILYRGTNMAIHRGLSRSTPFILGWTATAATAFLEDYKTGFQLGQLAIKLNQGKLADPKTKCKVYSLFAFFIGHWEAHLRDNIPILEEAISAGTTTGDLIWTGYALTVYSRTLFSLGAKLSDVVMQGRKAMDYVTRIQQPAIIHLQGLTSNAARNLMGETLGPDNFSTESWNENEGLEFFKKNHFFLGVALSAYFKQQNFYFQRRYNDSLTYARLAGENIKQLAGLFHVAEHYYYTSLALISVYLSEPQEEYLNEVHSNQQKLKARAQASPENFSQKYHLVEAELASLHKQDTEASDLYDLAASEANRAGFTQDEALACERAGRHWLSREKKLIARAYISEAHRLYLAWGAKLPARGLEVEFPEWGLGGPRKDTGSSSEWMQSDSPEPAPLTTIIGAGMELLTVLKASENITGEQKTERLMEILMEIIMENAGATRGCLILNSGNELILEILNDSAQAESKTLSLPLSRTNESQKFLPLSIIRYTQKTMKTLVLSDAGQENKFAGDTYLEKIKPRSVLCLPLKGRGKLLGFLYAEHLEAPGIFTEERIKILTLLTSQAALTLENTNLRALQELNLVRERHKIYTDMHDYLGGSLTDLALITRKLKEENKSNPELVGNLERIVQETIQNYRNCLTSAEDLKLMNENAADGLQLILLRRYSGEDRELDFHADADLAQIFADNANEKIKNVLYSAALELATNDLKYGRDRSLWRITFSGGKIHLKMEAGSDYAHQSRKPGRGTGNILYRVENVGGSVEAALEAGVFQIHITLPYD